MKIQYENDTELAEFEAFYKEYMRIAAASGR